MPHRTLSLLTPLAFLTLSLSALPADAFSTRVHIMISNKVREALIASDTGSIPLKFSPYSVRLSEVDRKALVDHPLAFRAGAIGPDNMAFPGMTDPSHAIGQNPFTQCQLLYEAALTDEERAYSMGCFLHGVTDAIAHHYVNYMSGETFTLTPISANRMTDYSNVVRHIVAESMIQKAAFTLDNRAFTTGQLAHTIPKSFVLRTYLDQQSPLWKLMARHAKAKFDAAVAANPNASLVTIVQGLDVGPADHLALTPVYLERIEAARVQVKRDIETAVIDMQSRATADGATLQVTAGADGKLGTSDDGTACSVGCATLYAKYFTYVALLAPRKDAQGRPLPSAFDKISDKLREDLNGFMPAYISTVEALSNRLNTPLTTGAENFDLTAAEVDALFKPLIDWSNNITTIDYQTVITAVVPDWLIALQQFFQSVGINVSIPNIVSALLQPFVQPIKDAIRAYVIDQAKGFIGELADKYKMQLDTLTASYDARLKTYAGAGLQGTMLDHFYDSGLFGHSFNITAATLSNHGLVLPIGETQGGIGPASFDASHTPAWMQPALCDYMRDAVFPLGTSVKAQLTVRTDKDFPAQNMEDSPIECHDGSLSMFTAMPGPASCELTDTKSLVSDTSHRGSPTRSYPPGYSAEPPTCQNLKVEGLPDPPTLAEPMGCGCHVGEGAPAANHFALALGALAGAALLLARRRRALRRTGAMLTLLLFGLLAPATGCGPEEMMNNNPDMMTMTMTGPKGMFLASLKDSVWQGMQMRAGKLRVIELRFDTASLLWSEIRNPFGPARRRELRAFTVDDDGATVHSTVITPTDWKDPDKQIGRKDDFTITVNAGTPRTLTVVKQGGGTETYTEGAVGAPIDGLTATVRVFTAGGPVESAFCTSGASGFNYSVFFDFARGRSAEPVLGTDTMAGAKLLKWRDASGANRFAVSDVPGFSDLGGTELSDQANFFVHYQGTLKHPGGQIQMRELNDSIEDGVWVWIDDKMGSNEVGSNNTNTIFLEVHGFVWDDDETVTTTLPAGDYPFEIITVRCAKQIEDMDVMITLGGSEKLVGNASTASLLNDTIFPPAL